MTVYESDLPGVGKKFEIELEGDRRLVIVTHHTGKREVFVKPDPDADSEKLFELSDRLARKVGTVLEGAYFQPVESERVETMLSEGTLLEWYGVDEEAELVGQTLSEADIGPRTGVTIVAIQRADETIASPGADAVIEAGDTLVVVGSKEGCRKFEALVSGNGDVDA